MARRARKNRRRKIRRTVLGAARRPRRTSTSRWCVKKGKRTLSCHRLKRRANIAARRRGGRVVKRGR